MWNDDYEGYEEDALTVEFAEDFFPEMGNRYWTNCFEYDMCEEDLSDHVNCFKIDLDGLEMLSDIESSIDYHFINENLLQQALHQTSIKASTSYRNCIKRSMIGQRYFP